MEKLKRITKLRPEWEAAIPEWNKKWIAAGLSTEPADFKAFERGAKQCYAFAGVPWPGIVVRVPSPIVGALAAPIAAKVIALARAGIFAPGIRPTKNTRISRAWRMPSRSIFSVLSIIAASYVAAFASTARAALQAEQFVFLYRCDSVINPSSAAMASS